MIIGFLLEVLKMLAVWAVIGGVFFLLILKDEYRRQTRGLNLNEQFDATMAELQRDIRMNMPYGTAVNKGGYAHFDY